MRGQHEIDPALAHRFHERQHVAARDSETAADAGGSQRSHEEVGIVHQLARSDGKRVLVQFAAVV